MKRVIILIICFLSIYSTNNAFFWSPTSLDLYKNIDKGIGELEDKMLTIELNGWVNKTSIIEEINKLAVIEEIKVCLDESKTITEKQLDDIIKNELTFELSKYLNINCFWNIDLTTKYLNLFKKYQTNSKKIADKKAYRIYKISNIWLYSDWILENSWFDLITDIEEIDKIIFASESEYEWESDVDLWKTINSALESIDEKMQNLTNPNKIDWKQSAQNINIPILYEPVINNIIDDTILINNNYVCADDSLNSWLSNDTLSFLINDFENNINSNNISVQNNNYWSWANWINEQGVNYTNLDWNYDKVRDNSEWPCEKFFCINIDYIMYQHNLFWWWENITIEYLLNRSNEHLKKFAATSLIPAKMSTNNFELWLKDINLPDIFHLSFQISTKPIPILNIEDNSKKDETEFAAKNMLEEYYKANWLDYKRRNDLNALKNIEPDKQLINNSEGITIDWVLYKWKDYINYKDNERKSIDFINKSVEKKVSYWIMQTFEEQYVELDKFTIAIYNYIKNINSIIKKMEIIPIDKG